ncbi:hypothetical protein LEP1GSC193_3236 [Leptospira alstonii serovar Pingchang str. 80-412]|uniref:Uncharacterized protein n=2 Tax=Leptospira alstonii TaxID=28452 RepID=M6D4H4_9LEPT|nr:hypothetical protein LEP1GSC194_3016 [Leptospira alstonii serovar Sichuan str. 79601]EQA79429.1 hypothetical protein LEP1GSC193_3236 [Leptospira alstonii serovar Pingchang str. 80-412]
MEFEKYVHQSRNLTEARRQKDGELKIQCLIFGAPGYFRKV